MELPQPRPFEAEGRKPIHDFLSACSNSTTIQPDPKPPSQSQGGNLKTHDFLQPLERVGRGCIGTSNNVDISMASMKSSSPASTSTLTPSSVQDQHVLPGGIGTYTISHIPYFYHQRLPKPEVSSSSPMFNVAQTSGNNERNVADENSNSNSNGSCSYAANGFTLWDESTGKKGQIMKERTNIRVDAATVIGQWQGLERLSQSSTNHHRNSFSSRSSSQGSGLKSQSFMDMIRSAKGSSQDDDLDDDEEDFIMKKENTSTSTQSQSQRDLRVKVDGKGSCNDQKPNTPRSKHSATEQRRRSKINDRFQMLRQLIPNSDQKRDKASFLLEVIEYIHFLQERVNKNEVPYQGWNHQEQGKLTNWKNDQQTGDENVDFAPKLEDKNNSQSIAIETSSFHEAAEPNQTSLMCPVSSDVEEVEEEEEEVCVHRGTISISSVVYSQGLLKTLTETLQTSGVDLSKASISVQIQLSKQPKKDQEVHRTVRARSDDDYIDDNNSSSKQQTKKQKKLKK